MTKNNLLACVLAPLVLTACHGSYTGPTHPKAKQSLRKTASFDLNCPEDELRAQKISGKCVKDGSYSNCVFGVRGCGGAARYVYFGNETWVADTVSGSRAQQREDAVN